MADDELVIVDTTVWSNFSHAGPPRRVLEAYPGSSSPMAVHLEIQEGLKLGYLPGHDWSWLPKTPLTDEEQVLAENFSARVDHGEAACLAVARARQALVLTDDRAARRLAERLELRVSGTLGVLVRLVEMDQLPRAEAEILLRKMIKAGYRSPVSSLSELFRECND